MTSSEKLLTLTNIVRLGSQNTSINCPPIPLLPCPVREELSKLDDDHPSVPIPPSSPTDVDEGPISVKRRPASKTLPLPKTAGKPGQARLIRQNAFVKR